MKKNVQQKNCAELHSITKGCEKIGVTICFVLEFVHRTPLIPSYLMLPLTNRFLMQ